MLPFIFAAVVTTAQADPCNRAPRVLKYAELEYPDDTELLGPGLLEVMLKITLDENGKVVKDEVIESSGYDAFDNAAMKAAEHSTYEPAEVKCAPSSSISVFAAEFQNKYIRDEGEITPPTFIFPDGWNAVAKTTPLPDSMSLIAEYARGDEHLLLVAQHPTPRFDGDGSAQQIVALMHLQPVNSQNGPMAICSGFQQAWSENFEYADGAAERSAELVEVQGANGLFSLLYTTPKGAPDDDAIDKAIDRLCVQGAPRAIPHNLGLPVG